MFIALIVADIVMAAAFGLTYNKLPPQVPIFYSRLWGEQQLADTYYIFLIPLLLNIFFFLNLYLYHQLFFPNELVRTIFYSLNWFFIIVATLFFLKTLFTIV